MERFTFDGQKTDRPASPERPNNLYRAGARDGGERGENWQGRTRESSVYTTAALHPLAAAGIFASVIGLGMWRLTRGVSRP
jgi:hypothetical protein